MGVEGSRRFESGPGTKPRLTRTSWVTQAGESTLTNSTADRPQLDGPESYGAVALLWPVALTPDHRVATVLR